MDSYCFDTEIGTFTAYSREGALVSLKMCPSENRKTSNEFLLATEKQISEFLAGERNEFSLPLALNGTDFQIRVWQALLEIPFGKTVSYGVVAEKIGYPKATRAVGNAVGANPIPVIIPCHRVIRKDGKMGNFGLGIPVKRVLLAKEGIFF